MKLTDVVTPALLSRTLQRTPGEEAELNERAERCKPLIEALVKQMEAEEGKSNSLARRVERSVAKYVLVALDAAIEEGTKGPVV